MSKLQPFKRTLAALLAVGAVAALVWFCASHRSIFMVDEFQYADGITELVVSDADFDDFEALQYYRHLQTLDLTAIDVTPERYEEIVGQVSKDVTVVWNVPLGSETFRNTVKSLTVTSDVPPEELNRLQYFEGLRRLSFDNYPLCSELCDALEAMSSADCDISCTTFVYDVAINSSTTSLTLNRIKIEDLEPLRLAIRLFPNITKVEMCYCGLSDEMMGGLREEYPDIQFVWVVHVLKYYVRTDAQSFSTLVNVGESFYGNEETFAPIFKYCTELRALDLGHHHIVDISEITHLTKLQTLILADNDIVDISPLAELKDLNYVELFFNKIQDVTPLTKLENLEDLNLCFNPRIKDATVLTQCKKLKRLYISGCRLSQKDIKTLRSGLPEGCEFNSWTDNAVNTGWRSNKKNAAIRRAFARWKKVKAYRRWDDVDYA